MGEPCVLGCYPGILLARDFQRWSRKKKWSFLPYNKSFIDRACSVKIAGYWPLFFLRIYCPRVRLGSLKKYTHTQKRAWPISRHLDLTLGQKRIYVERASRFHHVARSLCSALISQGCAFLLLSFFSFDPFSNALSSICARPLLPRTKRPNDSATLKDEDAGILWMLMITRWYQA